MVASLAGFNGEGAQGGTINCHYILTATDNLLHSIINRAGNSHDLELLFGFKSPLCRLNGQSGW